MGPFWVEDFLHIVFCTSFSSSQNGTGLVPQEPKKTQMNNTTVMTQRTTMGPKVPLIGIKNAQWEGHCK